MTLYSGQNQKMLASANIKDRINRTASNMNILAERMVENDKLVKLLTRNTNDVLSDDSKPTKEEKKEAFQKHITLKPVFDKELDNDTRLLIQIINATPDIDNQFYVYTIAFDIMVNLDNWILEDGLTRPLAIMNELDNILTNTKIDSMGPVQFLGFSNLKVTERVGGYTALYTYGDIL